MKRTVLASMLLVLIAAVALAQPAAAPSAPSEKKLPVDLTPTSLEGDWTLSSLTVMGTAAPAEQIDGSKLVVKGNQLIMVEKGQDVAEAVKEAAIFKLDEAASPKGITMHDNDSGETYTGIYKIEEGTLTILTGPPGGERPKNFDATDGIRMVLKKA